MENNNKLDFYIELGNGVKMPRIGLGTFKIENTAEVVYGSIKDGVRLIDTASVYQNEKQVGEGINRAISEGIVKREDLFVVTKLWTQDKHRVDESIKYQLAQLGLEYVDLYLDHFPFSSWLDDDTGKEISAPLHVLWPNMEKLVHQGYVRSLGVSNYNVQLLQDLLTYATIKPVVNQVELHPYLAQTDLVNFCMKQKIHIMAYNSLCKSPCVSKEALESHLLEDPKMVKYAEKYKTATGVLALNWALSQNIIVIPGTSNPNRMKENLTSLNFKLSEEELKDLQSLDKNLRSNKTATWEFSKKIEIFA
jgi:D-xylose reductase